MPYLIEASPQPKIKLSKLFASLGIELYIDSKGTYLTERDHGVSWIRNGRYCIVLNSADSIETRRLTLMHELAYIILGHHLPENAASPERREFEAESLGYILYSYIDNPFYGNSNIKE